MQKINSTRSFLALSAASLTLLPLVGAVQAQPREDAPAYGYRNKNNTNGNNANRNNGRNRNRNRNRGEDFGTVVTLEGVVTSVDDNNEFQVRAGGQTFDVKADSTVDVNQGERVVLRGAFDGDNNFDAQNVRVLGRGNSSRDNDGRNPRGGTYGNGTYGNGTYGNGTYGGNNPRGGYGNGGYYGGAANTTFQNGRSVSFAATIVRVLGKKEFDVRSDAGRTFRVEGRDNLNARRTGDRVQVSGIFRDNRITNARVTLRSGYGGGTYNNGGGYGNGTFGNGGTYNNGGGYNRGTYNNGTYNGVERAVDFPGRIVSLNSRDKSAIVRGDNGRTYRVVGSELKGFNIGDYVRVRGISSNGSIDLRDLNRI